VPQIEKACQFKVTYMEHYIVACKDAQIGGYLRPHRDTTTGTAHRRFAVTINLNAEDFTGRDLRFPEYGNRLFRCNTCGAVVFSCGMLHEATPLPSSASRCVRRRKKCRKRLAPSLRVADESRNPAHHSDFFARSGHSQS